MSPASYLEADASRFLRAVIGVLDVVGASGVDETHSRCRGCS